LNNKIELTVTGLPITNQAISGIFAGLLLMGQAMAGDIKAVEQDCYLTADGVTKCFDRFDDPSQTPASEPEIPPEATPSTVAPTELPETPAEESAPDSKSSLTEATVETAPDTTEQRETPNPWRLCAGAPSAAPRLDIGSIEAARRNATIDVEADSVELQEKQIYTLKGNVTFQRADQDLHAQFLKYDKQNGLVDAEGSIRYSESRVSVTSERIHLDMKSNHAEFEDVEYYLPAGHARGVAKTVSLEGPDLQRLRKATYTTCDAGQEDWRLSAKKVTLQQDKAVGRAHGVVMRFKKVPIFYTPYISFPLDDRRKSGFLAPTIGSSEESGADFRIPFYWNIAPHRDAIITPRYMEKRGKQIGAEFRYLNKNNKGKASVEYLPSDDEYGDDRSLYAIEHEGRLTPRLRTTLLFKEISDRQYFEDLGDSLNLSSTTHLERRAEINYRKRNFGLSARLQDFQTVDSAIADVDKPYERMPQIRLFAASPRQPLGLNARIRAEYTYFDHDVKISGHRLDLQPQVSLPVQKAGYYIKPQAGLRYTRYELDDPLTPGASEDPDRTTPIYSLDSGLFLERHSGWGSKRFLQTLEPRLFYLYVPKRDQDKLPVFDTGELDFQFNQMFIENRFNGPDRMGDANQATVALTSRILDPENGEQYLRASIGEIFYFRDLEVTLPGEDVITNGQSNLIAGLDMNLLRGLEFSSGIQWNPNKSRTDRAQARIQYKRDSRHILNLSYRFRRDILEQVDASLIWELTRKWSAVGRWNYSFDDDTTLGAFAGFEYDSCCWVLRFVARKFINKNDGDTTRSVFMQVEFKGLGVVGKPVDELLERAILGYRRNPID